MRRDSRYVIIWGEDKCDFSFVFVISWEIGWWPTFSRYRPPPGADLLQVRCKVLSYAGNQPSIAQYLPISAQGRFAVVSLLRTPRESMLLRPKADKRPYCVGIPVFGSRLLPATDYNRSRLYSVPGVKDNIANLKIVCHTTRSCCERSEKEHGRGQQPNPGPLRNRFRCIAGQWTKSIRCVR